VCAGVWVWTLDEEGTKKMELRTEWRKTDGEEEREDRHEKRKTYRRIIGRR
jgi:hypothetical protein